MHLSKFTIKRDYVKFSTFHQWIIKPISNLNVYKKNFFAVRMDLWNAVLSDLKNGRNVNVFQEKCSWLDGG